MVLYWQQYGITRRRLLAKEVQHCGVKSDWEVQLILLLGDRDDGHSRIWRYHPSESAGDALR